jgi:hypothetical protein
MADPTELSLAGGRYLVFPSTDPNPEDLNRSSKSFFFLRPTLSALHSLFSRGVQDKHSGRHTGGSKYDAILNKHGSLRPWVLVLVIVVLIPITIILIYIAEYVTRLLDHEGAIELVERENPGTYEPRRREEDGLSEGDSSDEECIVP